MDTKKFKMDLLNAEEMEGLPGGAATSCSKAGDTLYCNATVDYKLCSSSEIKCGGAVTVDCTGGKFAVYCPARVSTGGDAAVS